MAKKDPKQDKHDPTLGPQVNAVHVGGDSILDRVVPHIKKIALALVVLVVILTVFFTWRWWKHRTAEKSTNRLALAIEMGKKSVAPPEAAGALPDMYESYAERDEAVLGALRKVGKVRGAAAMYEARLLYTAGKYDDALAMYRRLGTGAGEDGALAREGIGIVLEAKASAATDSAEQHKLLEEAAAAFRAVQTEDRGPRRDWGLYHEARVLQALGKPAEAIASLKKALEVVPDTAIESMIKERLALLGAPVEGT